MIAIAKKAYSYLETRHPVKAKILRYIISGGTAAVVDLFLLYAFTDWLGIWYLLSAILAFLVAFMVSFAMQKYWTFKDRSNENIHGQAAKYFAVTATNLGLNTLGIFLLVDYVHVHYMLSQILVSALIAVESFFVYHLIFKGQKPLEETVQI